MKITIAGTRYICTLIECNLLAHYNEVIALDILHEKVDMITNNRSPSLVMRLQSF